MARRAAPAAAAALVLLFLWWLRPALPPPPPRWTIVYQSPPTNATIAAVRATCTRLRPAACETVLLSALLAVVGRPTARERAALAAAAPVAAVERDAPVARHADAAVRRDEAAGARLGQEPFASLARAAAAAAVPPTPGPRPSALWGLARISQRSAGPLPAAYNPAPDFAATLGQGVDIFVLDSGVAPTAELGSRVVPGPDFVSPRADAAADAPITADAADCDGHGTHVAGLAAGASAGVAPRARIIAPRVLECNGGGRASAVAAAVDWAVAHKAGPAVIVLSLGAAAADGGVAAMEAALTGAIQRGVVVVAAAGNDRADACAASPARLPGAITVAASDSSFKFQGALLQPAPPRRGGAVAALGGTAVPSRDPPYTFSSSGPCVALFAPGADMLSACGGPPGARCADPSADRALAWASGTSMAAPLVAGAAALLLAAGVPPADVRAQLIERATAGAVDTGQCVAGTPDRLLFVGAG